MASKPSRLSVYARSIREHTNCTAREAELLEVIMLHNIFHSTALDWVRPDQFRTASLEAITILDDFRAVGNMPEIWRRFLAGENVVL